MNNDDFLWLFNDFPATFMQDQEKYLLNLQFTKCLVITNDGIHPNCGF